MITRIVTIDDDINTLKSLEQLLELKKFKVFPHLTVNDAMNNFDKDDPHIAIIDFYLDDMTGVELMKKIHQRNPDIPVIILTASREINTAIESIKAGAYHYLVKPVQPDELYSTIDKLVESQRLKEENLRLKNELTAKYRFENIIGKSAALEEMFAILAKAVQTKSTILITGDSGTGKELVARAAHYNSPRKDNPFIKVNCAAIPESMLEAELFGIEKNVATGVAMRPGKFELADGGSIFLDEIGDMAPSTQAKVLRVLQEREVERIGASAPKKVDIRVIAATNIDIAKAVEEKKFRQDLLYRLNVFHIHIPPLSKRKDDIPLLAEHFIQKYSKENGMEPKKMEHEAMDYLSSRDWPGNIRELENTIERAIGISDGDMIKVCDFDQGITFRSPAKSATVLPAVGLDGKSLDDIVADFERDIITNALVENRWKQNKTAEQLGISERSIWYKIKKLGIDMKKADSEE